MFIWHVWQSTGVSDVPHHMIPETPDPNQLSPGIGNCRLLFTNILNGKIDIHNQLMMK